MVVFIAVRNLVGIDDDDDFIGMAANRLDYLQTKYSVNCKNTKMSNYRVNYILDIMVQTIRYKRMSTFNSSAF